MNNPAPAAPRAATLPEGTPGRVRAILEKKKPSRGNAPSAPAPLPRAPKIPGDRKRGRPPKMAGELSQHPEAVKARQRREEQRTRAARVLTPPDARTSDGATMTPDAMRPAAPAVHSGPVLSPPAPMRRELPADVRALSVKSLSGGIKVLGILAALFWGDDMKVPDDDAVQTADLCLDAWPELADQLGDTAKFLAIGAIGGLVAERVQVVKQRRTAPARATSPSMAPAAARPMPMDAQTMPG